MEWRSTCKHIQEIPPTPPATPPPPFTKDRGLNFDRQVWRGGMFQQGDMIYFAHNVTTRRPLRKASIIKISVWGEWDIINWWPSNNIFFVWKGFFLCAWVWSCSVLNPTPPCDYHHWPPPPASSDNPFFLGMMSSGQGHTRGVSVLRKFPGEPCFTRPHRFFAGTADAARRSERHTPPPFPRALPNVSVCPVWVSQWPTPHIERLAGLSLLAAGWLWEWGVICTVALTVNCVSKQKASPSPVGKRQGSPLCRD